MDKPRIPRPQTTQSEQAESCARDIEQKARELRKLTQQKMGKEFAQFRREMVRPSVDVS